MCCSRCGKLCSECSQREEYGCDGCTKIKDGYWGSKCEIKECCEGKSLEHCGLCKDFPCELLREFCYDKETGDEGERLLNCKRWADEARIQKEVFIRNILLGTVGGGIVGVIFGEIQGMTAAFIFGGLIVGIGIAILIEVNKNHLK